MKIKRFADGEIYVQVRGGEGGGEQGRGGVGLQPRPGGGLTWAGRTGRCQAARGRGTGMQPAGRVAGSGPASPSPHQPPSPTPASPAFLEPHPPPSPPPGGRVHPRLRRLPHPAHHAPRQRQHDGAADHDRRLQARLCPLHHRSAALLWLRARRQEDAGEGCRRGEGGRRACSRGLAVAGRQAAGGWAGWWAGRRRDGGMPRAAGCVSRAARAFPRRGPPKPRRRRPHRPHPPPPQGREAIAAKLSANIITEAGADRVLAMDLHSGQCVGYFDIPVDHVYGDSGGWVGGGGVHGWRACVCAVV